MTEAFATARHRSCYGGVTPATTIDGNEAAARIALASALFRHGVEHLATITQDLLRWMQEHEYASIRQFLHPTIGRRRIPTDDNLGP